MMGKLNDLEHAGQAVWLDFLDRQGRAGAGLGKRVDEHAVPADTAEPAIF